MKHNVSHHTWYRHHDRAPLLVAIQSGDTDAVRAAVAAGMPLTRFRQDYANGRGHGWSVLGFAVTYTPAEYDLAMVQALADLGANLNEADSSGDAPIWLARSERIRHELYDRGATPFRIKRGTDDLVDYVAHVSPPVRPVLVAHESVVRWFVEAVGDYDVRWDLLKQWAAQAADHPKTARKTKTTLRAIVCFALDQGDYKAEEHRAELEAIADRLGGPGAGPPVGVNKRGAIKHPDFI